MEKGLEDALENTYIDDGCGNIRKLKRKNGGGNEKQ
jgi:hypothetical protein